MTRRRVKATSAAPPNPTLTEGQLAGELERWQEAQRSAAIAVCGHAIKAGWQKSEVARVLRIVIDRDTLQRWGMAPDPVPSAAGKYQWGRAKGESA